MESWRVFETFVNDWRTELQNLLFRIEGCLVVRFVKRVLAVVRFGDVKVIGGGEGGCLDMGLRVLEM